MRFLQDHNHHFVFREARFGACLLGLLTLSLLAGCGGGGGGSSSPTPTPVPTPTPTPTPPALTVSGMTATGLTASLTEASGTVSVNGTLVYTLTLTNTTANAIPVHATRIPVTTPAAGLIITGPSGAITFSPVPGAPGIENGSLAAGQSVSLTETANGFTAPGVYSATATFSDDTTALKSVGPLTVTAQ
jgi:hypothetical protein